VEVLSPTTRHLDLAFKRARYEAAGCPSYWVVDPLEPSIVCWELRDGRYEEVASDGHSADHAYCPISDQFRTGATDRLNGH
jgi:Uma2 family endonuclease